MALSDDGLVANSALVIDSNPTSRSILISQLKGFGVDSVVQATRLADARRQLEYRTFDIVLCEHHFINDASSGQDLLDDLRRNQLLPFSTVFVMVTGEATYAKVAEAAESALDGYLLKPHTATALGERLRSARNRKVSLQAIFKAIEAEQFEQAASLCLERFEARGPYCLYAARVGAELLLRTGQLSQAQTLYEAVVAAKTLPWAKLGVARSQLDAGQTQQAISTLENLINEDPGYADAYDVLGKAQFEVGKFDKALEIYRVACDKTPSSISRLQNLGMMAFYSGDRVEAEKVLDKTTRLGLDSKMFDCQTLVLLAFARLDSGDKRGLKRCEDDFVRLIERNPDSTRHKRLANVVGALGLIQQHQFARVVDVVRVMVPDVQAPDFDFESASNLLALLAQLSNKAIQLDEVESVVERIGMRFCTNRSLTELLAGACGVHPPYADMVRNCQVQVLKLAESAMSLSMAGDPGAAVRTLIQHGESTLSAKLIETAWLVLQRYCDKIDGASALSDTVDGLRNRYCAANSRPSLGAGKRSAGGVTLRSGAKPTPSKNAAKAS